LVDVNMDVRIIRKVQRIFLIVPFTYLFAICVSFVSIPASLVLYALIPVLYIRPPREDRHLTSLGSQAINRDNSVTKT
jgi:hypothetical protein